MGQHVRDGLAERRAGINCDDLHTDGGARPPIWFAATPWRRRYRDRRPRLTRHRSPGPSWGSSRVHTAAPIGGRRVAEEPHLLVRVLINAQAGHRPAVRVGHGGRGGVDHRGRRSPCHCERRATLRTAQPAQATVSHRDFEPCGGSCPAGPRWSVRRMVFFCKRVRCLRSDACATTPALRHQPARPGPVQRSLMHPSCEHPS
jgi:hypothetical protein